MYAFNEEFDIGNGLGPVPENLKGGLVGDVKQMMLQNKNIIQFLKRMELWLEKETEEEASKDKS